MNNGRKIMELPEKITTEVQYPEWFKDRDWAGEQQERAYWEAHKTLRELYGPKVPEEFQEFVLWLDGKVMGEPDGHF